MKEVRFAPSVRNLVTVQFQIMFMVYIGVITYLPALALETSTGLNRFTALWLICGTCIIYTSMGGLKVGSNYWVVRIDLDQYIHNNVKEKRKYQEHCMP